MVMSARAVVPALGAKGPFMSQMNWAVVWLSSGLRNCAERGPLARAYGMRVHAAASALPRRYTVTSGSSALAGSVRVGALHARVSAAISMIEAFGVLRGAGGWTAPSAPPS